MLPQAAVHRAHVHGGNVVKGVAAGALWGVESEEWGVEHSFSPSASRECSSPDRSSVAQSGPNSGREQSSQSGRRFTGPGPPQHA
jgi:hypothetical protein